MAATVRLSDEGGPPLEAAELFFHDGLTLVATHLGLPFPFPRPAPAYLLVEWSGDQVPPVVGRLEGVIDVAIGQDSSRRASLWRYREAHTEAANSLGSPPHKLDVTLPLGRLAEFIDDVRRLVSELVPAGRCVLFGHAGDGNIHVNVIGPSPDDDTVDDAVMRLVAGFGGSISSEHGIGTAKKAWIHLNRSPAELAVFAAIKAALDPKGILNPNALLPSSHPKSARDQ